MSTPKIYNGLSFAMTPEGTGTDSVALVSAPLEVEESKSALLVSEVMLGRTEFPPPVLASDAV